MAAKCASLNRHRIKENLFEKNIDGETETGVIRRTGCYSVGFYIIAASSMSGKS